MYIFMKEKNESILLYIPSFRTFQISIKSYAQYENSSYLIDRLMNSLKKVNRIFYQMKLNIIPLTLTFYYLCHLCVTYYAYYHVLLWFYYSIFEKGLQPIRKIKSALCEQNIIQKAGGRLLTRITLGRYLYRNCILAIDEYYWIFTIKHATLNLFNKGRLTRDNFGN